MLGKVTKFQRIISKALRDMDKNLWRVPKDLPGLNRVNTLQNFTFMGATVFEIVGGRGRGVRLGKGRVKTLF